MKTALLMPLFIALSLPAQIQETDPEKEGHVHENDSERRRSWSHGDSQELCKKFGYCFPSGHDPATWRKYLPEGTVLHACPKVAVCHPEKTQEHQKQYCGDVNGKGTRYHCDQSCREQCCFCCGSP